jgi:hypothetical protein
MKSRHPYLSVLVGLALAGTLQGAESRATSARSTPAAPPAPATIESTRPPEPPELPEIAEAQAAMEAGAADFAETIRSQVEQTARDAERQLRGLRGGLSRLRTNLGETYLQGGGPNVFRSLVLPAGDEPRDSGAIKEELAIMGRLIEKSLQPESERKSNPFRLEFGGIHMGGRNDLDALYLEGYGVVFFIEVDYPLAAAPVREEKTAEARPAKDDAWEQARREVRGEPDPNEELPGIALFTSEARPFDAARVDALKERMIEALQQARNLKCLRDSETVTLVISGAAPRNGSARRTRSSVAGTGTKPTQVYVVEGPAGGAGEAGSVMTLKVGRAELEALASEKLKAEDFASKVRVVNRLETAGEPDAGARESALPRRPGR